MKLTKSGPLTDREIDWLEEILMKYGMDDSVLCFSELDGLLTAILSGPKYGFTQYLAECYLGKRRLSSEMVI